MPCDLLITHSAFPGLRAEARPPRLQGDPDATSCDRAFQTPEVLARLHTPQPQASLKSAFIFQGEELKTPSKQTQKRQVQLRAYFLAT